MPPLERLLARDEHVHLATREHEVVLVGPFLRACIVLTACSYASVRIAATGAPLPLRLLAVGILGVLALRTLVRLTRAVGRWQRRVLVVTDRRALLLPDSLRKRTITAASLRDGRLRVTFASPTTSTGARGQVATGSGRAPGGTR